VVVKPELHADRYVLLGGLGVLSIELASIKWVCNVGRVGCNQQFVGQGQWFTFCLQHLKLND